MYDFMGPNFNRQRKELLTDKGKSSIPPFFRLFVPISSLSIFLSISLSLSVSVSLFLSLSLCVSVGVSLCVCLYLSTYVSLVLPSSSVHRFIQ